MEYTKGLSITLARNWGILAYQKPKPKARISCHDGSLGMTEPNKLSRLSEW